MLLYLVRHGEAVPERENPERPLSARGREQVRLVAAVLRGLEPTIDRIVHSEKIRARETAELIAASLPRGAPPVEAQADLLPDDHPADTARMIRGSAESLMVVGHMPHLSRLTSLLLGGDPDREIADLDAASVVALNRAGEVWQLRWILTPEIAGAART
jgi:phosphohistidine phosphatase